MAKSAALPVSARLAALLSWQGLAGFILIAGFSLLIWRTSANAAFVICFLAGILPLAVCALPFWWCDGLPSFGFKWLFFALAWGSFVASCASLLIANFMTIFISYVVIYHLGWSPDEAQHMSHFLTAIFSTPMMEEIAKGSLLVLLLWHPKRLITGAWHGVWFSSLVALGFGWAENAVLASDITRHGSSPWEIFWGRTYLPIAHIGMTLPLGLAIGLASRIPSLSQRLAVILVGWVMAVCIHASWNWYGLFRHEDSSFWISIPFLSSSIITLTVITLFVTYILESRSLLKHTNSSATDNDRDKILRLAQLHRLALSLPPDEVETHERNRLESGFQTEGVTVPTAG